VGNGEAFLSALDLATGRPAWTVELARSWSRWSLGTPALAHGLLFVPTPREHLLAIDAATGAVRWKASAGWSRIHPVAYQRRARGFLASPVVTGDLVWAGGIDGVLRAFDAHSGRERWKSDLGAPIVGGLVPSGDLLFVVTYDGVVRALSAAPAATPDPPVTESCADGWGSFALLMALAAAALLRRGARRRPGPLTGR
jgi:eukaryotic-like serine/threonine-protein kinase